MQLLIQCVSVTIDVLFNNIQNRLKLLDLGAYVVLQVVEHNCDRNSFKDV